LRKKRQSFTIFVTYSVANRYTGGALLKSTTKHHQVKQVVLVAKGGG
jgi:hypothetical protein